MTVDGIDEKPVGATPPPLPGNHSKPLTPVSSGERIVSLDVMRGVSLLGILIANMVFFSQPLETDTFRNAFWFSPVDKWADWLSVFMVEGKFYPLFAFLFGLGFAIQMDRASSRGLNFGSVYRRRLLLLFGFGIAHRIFLWDGDVLIYYAGCGFGLLLFQNRKLKTIVIWAATLILLPGLLVLIFGLLLVAMAAIPEFSESMRESMIEDPEVRLEMIRVFITGGYWDVVSHRIGEMLLHILIMMAFTPAFFGLFLLGLFAGRKGIVSDVARHRKSWVRLLVIGGLVGLVANSLGAWAVIVGSEGKDIGVLLIGHGTISIFGPVLTSAYIAGIVLLIGRLPSLAILSPIASVGQMALTNYLAQSAIATTIFYGYGFGMGGEVGRLGTIGMALVIFAAQVFFSFLWLKNFRYWADGMALAEPNLWKAAANEAVIPLERGLQSAKGHDDCGLKSAHRSRTLLC